MSASFGHTYKTTIFGESHGPGIGCIIQGAPAGFQVDKQKLADFLGRRRPNTRLWSTPRAETDTPIFVSGITDDGIIEGTPICALIKNKDARSHAYDKLRDTPRPSHADFAANAKWKGNQDIRGGGHFSGRLTASLCISGGIAKQILEDKGIQISAHILQIGPYKDISFAAQKTDDTHRQKLKEQMDSLSKTWLPVLDPQAAEDILAYMDKIQSQGDSCGGIIECVVTGVTPGLGTPRFDGIDARLAQAALAIPGCKAFEMGEGFGFADILGSEANDPYIKDHDKILPLTNNSGGVTGGVTTGAPLWFKVGIKPTPSIQAPQTTLNVKTGRLETLNVPGRHDSCIVPRVVPVVEGVCAATLLDILESEAFEHI